MNENQHLVLVQAFVAQLYQGGVRDVCLSPGSRSTPLTMAFIRHGGFSLWSVLDERSAGFFAIGLARGKQSPVVLVCTSGTATGNYLPAVMEAHNARLPLLVLTADRPPELYDTGANQTVHQRGLYGSLVKWHHDMPVPLATEPLLRHAISVGARAIAMASAAPMGPVHVNWPFREPLIIPDEPFELPTVGSGASSLRVWEPRAELDSATVAELQQQLGGYERGLIICGPMWDSQFPEALTNLAEALNWPVLADPLSQLRSGQHAKTHLVESYDTLLRSHSFRQAVKPDVIIRFGATMTSKVLNQYLSEAADVRQIVVDEGSVWVDPVFTATDVVHVNATVFCQQVQNGLVAPQAESPWLSIWQDGNHLVCDSFTDHARAKPWYEGQLVHELLAALPDETNLFVGNSMPIRDVDTFMESTSKSIHLFANRGVSGIDGVVSSAIGVAASSQTPTVLFIGDVSFYHDLNALLIAARHHLNLLIVLVNNDGGGIFSFLPQAQHEDAFPHFRTAHGLTFAAASELYGAKYTEVHDWSTFGKALAEDANTSGVRLLELTFDSAENRQTHQELFVRVDEALQAHLQLEAIPWKR